MLKKLLIAPLFYIGLFFFPLLAMASESGHHEISVWDLKWPFVNFLILFFGIFVLSKKKLSDYFSNYSGEVEKLVNYAQEKDKEAQIKLDMFQKKLENFEHQKQKIEQETKQDLEKHEAQLQFELKNEMERITRDNENRLETEKKLAMGRVYSELAEKIVNNAKTKFFQNKDLKDKATEKILSQIR